MDSAPSAPASAADALALSAPEATAQKYASNFGVSFSQTRLWPAAAASEVAACSSRASDAPAPVAASSMSASLYQMRLWGPLAVAAPPDLDEVGRRAEALLAGQATQANHAEVEAEAEAEAEVDAEDVCGEAAAPSTCGLAGAAAGSSTLRDAPASPEALMAPETPGSPERPDADDELQAGEDIAATQLDESGAEDASELEAATPLPRAGGPRAACFTPDKPDPPAGVGRSGSSLARARGSGPTKDAPRGLATLAAALAAPVSGRRHEAPADFAVVCTAAASSAASRQPRLCDPPPDTPTGAQAKARGAARATRPSAIAPPASPEPLRRPRPEPTEPATPPAKRRAVSPPGSASALKRPTGLLSQALQVARTAAPSGALVQAFTEVPLQTRAPPEDRHGSERPQRLRMRPLEAWRCERVTYRRERGSAAPTVDTAVLSTATASAGSARARSASSKRSQPVPQALEFVGLQGSALRSTIYELPGALATVSLREAVGILHVMQGAVRYAPCEGEDELELRAGDTGRLSGVSGDVSVTAVGPGGARFRWVACLGPRAGGRRAR